MTLWKTGADVRRGCREGAVIGPTPGMAFGYVQANLVILPQEYAFDFLLFCQRNPKPCPLLDVTEPGDPTPRLTAPTADLRTDLPAYRVFENGEVVDEPHSITHLWRDDFVSFLIGCSFTFENALTTAGLAVRHIEQGCNVPMYRTNIACRSAGRFAGPMVVSMRPYLPSQALHASLICQNYPRAHGSPIHTGNPSLIGISDLAKPDYGDAVDVGKDEIPVFWACGVTPQAVIAQSKLPYVITHKPGHMFLTDLRDIDLVGEDRVL